MRKQPLALTLLSICCVLTLSANAKAQTPSELIRSGISAHDAGNYDQAIADYTRAIQLDPSVAVAYMNRGNSYLKKREIDTALRDFDRAIQLNPAFALAYNNRGNAYSDKGEAALALADYDKAIQLAPDLDLAYSNRGLSYIQQGNYDQAMVDLNHALQLNPNLVEAWVNRGLAYYQKGQYPAAEADAMKALKLRPGLAQAEDLRKLAHDKYVLPPPAMLPMYDATPNPAPYKCLQAEIYTPLKSVKFGEPILLAAKPGGEFYIRRSNERWPQFVWSVTAGRLKPSDSMAVVDTSGISSSQLLTVSLEIEDSEHPQCRESSFASVTVKVLPPDPKPIATYLVPLNEETNARIWLEVKRWRELKSSGVMGDELEIRFIAGPRTTRSEGIVVLNRLKAYLLRQNIDLGGIKFLSAGIGEKSIVELWLLPRSKP